MNINCQSSLTPQLENDFCQGDKKATQCIISLKALTYLQLPTNSTLEDIIDAQLQSLADARIRIGQLETETANFTNVSPTVIATTSNLTSTAKITTRKVNATTGNIVLTILNPQVGQIYNFKRTDATGNTVTIASTGVTFETSLVPVAPTTLRIQFLSLTEAITI